MSGNFIQHLRIPMRVLGSQRVNYPPSWKATDFETISQRLINGLLDSRSPVASQPPDYTGMEEICLVSCHWLRPKFGTPIKFRGER